MEHGKVELGLVKEAEEFAAEKGFAELAEVQLALVGGGCGEVVFH